MHLFIGFIYSLTNSLINYFCIDLSICSFTGSWTYWFLCSPVKSHLHYQTSGTTNTLLGKHVSRPENNYIKKSLLLLTYSCHTSNMFSRNRWFKPWTWSSCFRESIFNVHQFQKTFIFSFIWVKLDVFFQNSLNNQICNFALKLLAGAPRASRKILPAIVPQNAPNTI